MAPIIAVTGLNFEARIAAAEGVRVVSSGPGRNVNPALDIALAQGARGLISFGLAGGLVEGLPPGKCMLAQRVITPTGRSIDADAEWTDRMADLLGNARIVDMAGSDYPIMTTDAKAAMHKRTGAECVDMESHIVSEAAARAGIPFTACRIIIDPLDQEIPEVAIKGMRQDGETDAWSVVRALTHRPGQLPALLQIARDAGIAYAALLRCRRRLGPRLGFPNIGEHLLDVA